jgi:subtilisin family serine protease
VLGVMGTSQAAPHVAALAALLVEDHGFNNPLDIRRRIQRTSADLGPVGKDAFYGHGRIDAAKALRVPSLLWPIEVARVRSGQSALARRPDPS